MKILPLAGVVSVALSAASSGCFPLDRSAGLEDRCVEATPWAPGTPLFRERTDLGLAGVNGQRISAVDVDDDGDADLVVRDVGAVENDTSLAQDDAARSGWLMLNDGNGHFVDGSKASSLWKPRGGFAIGRPGEVMAFADVNGDGRLDAFAGVDTTNAAAAGETSEIFLGVDGGRFSLGDADNELRRDYGLDGRADLPAAASFTDVDGDGHLDLWVPEHNYEGLNFIGDRLYQGDGAGHFTDVGDQFGVVSAEWSDDAALNAGLAHTRSWSGAACDLDDDGRPELLAASYGRAPNHLWHNVAGASFDNVSVASGYAFDGDFGWQDNQFAVCFCTQNPSADGCDEVTSSPLLDCSQPNWDNNSDREPARLGGNNATSVCADVDNDGDLDVLTTTIKHWWAGSGADMAELLLNHSHDGANEGVVLDRPGRDATGIVVEHNTGVAWDEGFMTAAVFDVDNDGRVDLYLGGSDYAGNRGLFFHNDGLGDDGLPKFSPMGIDDTFEHNRSHGIAVADFDGDGDLDVVVGHSRSRCDANEPNDCYATSNVRFFENLTNDSSNFVKLHLTQKTGSNTKAIGARITVKTVVDGKELVQTREVGGGHGHFGMQDDLVQTLGLGAACEAEVTVRWSAKDAAPQTFTVTAGHRFSVVEGEDVVVDAYDAVSPSGR